LSIDALPSLENAGKDLGLWDASVTLPAIIAPLLGSLIINIGNHFGQLELGYRMVFSTAAVFLVVAAICVLFVRENR
jgi:MFS family permease